MYSKSSWGGSVDPFILTKYNKAKDSDDKDTFVSVIIYEFKDEDLVGMWPSPEAPEVSILGTSLLTQQHRLMKLGRKC